MPSGKLPEIFISPSEAGRLLGCGQESIETGLRNGSFPIGWAWTTTEGKKRGQWNYRIPRQALLNAIDTGLLGGGLAPVKQTECRLYNIWQDMLQRCTNRNHPQYNYFGGRGIGYAYEWERYPEFEKWAYLFGYREYLVLERRNELLGFTPTNCSWVPYEKRQYRSVHLFTLDGETHSIQEWAEIWGVPRSTARNRIYTLESKVEADSA